LKNHPRVVAFVASNSGAGKTTLLEGVVKELKGKGYRVGVVKHSIHNAGLDREGSDSWRISKAGADVTVLAAGDQVAVVRNVDDLSMDTVLKEASSHTDIVLLEGFRGMDVPKIEVFRSGHSKMLHCRDLDEPDAFLAAVASDIPLDLDVPVLDLNNPEEVCEFIIERFINPIED